MSKEVKEVRVEIPLPHDKQREFIDCEKKRKIIRAGRRGGKTVGVGIDDIGEFIKGRRVLYAAPTSEQTDRYWSVVNTSLQPLIDTKKYRINNTERYIENRQNPENRIKAKTAWNADSLRGDYADKLTFDEWQLMCEDAWEDVGAPMLLDNGGDATFIYTPPSLKTSGVSKARDPRHASKMFKMAESDTTGRWACFHFTSHDNPHISEEALSDITFDMSRESYLKEIMAEDDDSQLNLLVYGAFNERICKIPRFEIPAHWIVYSGHDFGSANPAALFIAEDPATGFFYCFREYVPLEGKSAYQNVQNMLELTKGHNVRLRVGGSHQEEENRQAYAAQGWPITEPFITKVPAQIDRTKSLFEKNKIFIFEDMYRLLEQINSCLWKTDEFGRPTNVIKNEARFHLLACLRYVCSVFRPEVNRTEDSGGVLVMTPGMYAK